MAQSLRIQSALKTHLHDQEAVSVYGVQMTEKTLYDIHIVNYSTDREKDDFCSIIFNMLTRHEYREKLIFVLYQHLLLHKDLRACYEDVLETDTDEFSDQVIEDLVANKGLYIKEISQYLVKWSFDRLNLVEQAILLETVSEMKQNLNDRAVAINEAVIFSKEYCDEDSYKYINGVLDHICVN